MGALPAIPATQEPEARRIRVRSQPRQIVLKTLSRKNPSQKRAGGVAQGIGPEFKPKEKRKRKKKSTFTNQQQNLDHAWVLAIFKKVLLSLQLKNNNNRPGMEVHAVIPAIQEVKVGGSQSEVSLGKSRRPYLKNKLKTQTH
jgi:hypothetical protein